MDSGNGAEQRFEKVPSIVLAIVGAMLWAATLRWPYGYYSLLRLVVCGSAAFEGCSGLMASKKSVVSWIAIGIALLFNPLIPVYLHKADWVPIDVAVGVCYASLAVVRFRSEQKARSH